MNLEHIDSFSIPEWSVCALEYGDFSGLTYDEINQINTFATDYPQDKYLWHWERTFHFSNSPAFGLPCECVDVLIYERAKETL